MAENARLEPFEGAHVRGEIAGRLLRVGVVLPQHPAAPGQGVFVQLPRRLVLTQRAQVVGEVAGGDQDVAAHAGAQALLHVGTRPPRIR